MRQQSEKEEFIICTEEGVGYELKRQNPEKQFYYPKSVPVCPNMKKVTLDKVLHVLQTGENEVHVDAELREEDEASAGAYVTACKIKNCSCYIIRRDKSEREKSGCGYRRNRSIRSVPCVESPGR